MGLDWKAINPLNGSRAAAFEELCAQLARTHSPAHAKFIRKGSPDAGVECFCVLPDGSEWGWQAKYFDTLGPSQSSQLDESVKTALDKHSSLVRYYICAPMDRPDSKVHNRKSALERWNEHVQKWQAWARDRHMNVEYIWWGSSELIDLLSKQSECGRLLFWFGQTEFNRSWFESRLQEAIQTAGPRYTPEIHVDLDIAQQLATFARADHAFNELKSLARKIRSEFRHIGPSHSRDDQYRQHFDLSELTQAQTTILEKFAALESTPVDEIRFGAIANEIHAAESKADSVLEQLRQLEQDDKARENSDIAVNSYRNNPYTSWSRRIHALQRELSQARARLSEAERFVNSRLMIIKGAGGIGKTHLLCDFASDRVENGKPVVLLLGQWFSQPGEPWTQLLQQLGLRNVSPEQFIGALEAAAQAADSRALLLIDALNEGCGREIWLKHLPSFLTRLQRSPWISVLLSVRSSYEADIVPTTVREGAVELTHHGFADREYDAGKTFFSYYDLEFPSSPILHPEFRNPLFLKTICQGLQYKGERRIPRGFHGVTAVFDLYLEAINEKLSASSQVDYNPKDNVVHKVLVRIAKEFHQTQRQWISIARAAEVVNQLLPPTVFSKSLYRGLVDEGVLVEDRARWTDESSEEVVRIPYERFADHMLADFLLGTHLDTANPAAAFNENGGLAFICDEDSHVASGLIEALSIQVPERAGEELVRLAPKLRNHPLIGEMLLESIIWRSPHAFSDDTRKLLDELIEDKRIGRELTDALLTVSTIPRHPFNANLLDRWLRRHPMPERDACWSIYLHESWKTQGPVDRLVDWASNLAVGYQLEESVVDLAAIALGWMLTTSNRFLRDRATKALVSLLTGRFESTARLVRRFSDVDDPYVAERVYAVAYGVAMRTHDAKTVGQLASLVYKHVFASGTPPTHILLRDYARGVIERAIFLGSDIEFDETLVRPPYKSAWPCIPGEDILGALTPQWDTGARDGGDLEWSRNRIRSSVMSDDFASYVIRTNFSSNWLSVWLDDDQWQSPQERTDALRATLGESELLALEEFEKAQERRPIVVNFVPANEADINTITLGKEKGDEISTGRAQAEVGQHQLDNDLELKRQKLISVFTEDHLAELDSILSDKNDVERRQGPRFDLKLIQQYILWRVFNLGWTVERFGYFDQFQVSQRGREAAKAERIGKKYQWIAYHEILAYISDHYQYRTLFAEDEGGRRYEGPWQESLRDIDPSITVTSTPGGTSWGAHKPSWWAKALYESWDDGLSKSQWLSNTKDIPKVEELLKTIRPSDGTSWLNVNGHFEWCQPHPADVDPYDVERRMVWLSCNGYFIRAGDFEHVIECRMPSPADLRGPFLGEFRWSPAYKYFDASVDIHAGLHGPKFVRPATGFYSSEMRDFDCSLDHAFSLQLPHHTFVERLGLKWFGRGADYLDQRGNLAAFDPTVHEEGPTALLLREDVLRRYLAEEELVLCWQIDGEKLIMGEKFSLTFQGSLEISGFYRYTNDGPVGELTYIYRKAEDT